MSCDAISSRAEYQQRLRELNPAFVRHHVEGGSQQPPSDPAADSSAHSYTRLVSPSLGAQPAVPRNLRPDGDSDLRADLDFSTFQLPSCTVCTDGHGRPHNPPDGSSAEEVYEQAPMQVGVLKRQ